PRRFPARRCRYPRHSPPEGDGLPASSLSFAAAVCSCRPLSSVFRVLPAASPYSTSLQPLPLRPRPGRANESTLLIGISLKPAQTVTTVWRTEPGTTLIVGFNSTTVLSAYFRTCAFISVHRTRPL